MSEAKRHDSTSLRSSWIDWRPFDAAPAERLALLRILVGLYTLAYLAAHAGMFSAMSRTDAADFRPIGVLRWMDRPIAPDLAQDVFAMTVASTVLFTIGWLHRPAALVHSILLLIIMTYRNSWSMIYHSQNLVVLHTVVLAIAPASQVWSLDAWRHSKSAESKRSQTKGESKDAAARLTRQRHSSSSSQPSSPKPPPTSITPGSMAGLSG